MKYCIQTPGLWHTGQLKTSKWSVRHRPWIWKYCILIGLILAFASCTEKVEENNPERYQTLKEGFINPPNPARPKVYWWWLNGYVDTTRLKEELLAIKKAGIGGVDIFEIGTTRYSNPDNMVPAGPAFMSEASLGCHPICH